MNRLIKFTNDNGFDNVKYESEYKGCEMYSLIYRDDEQAHCIGTPMSIISDNGKLRMSEPKEGFDILRFLCENDDKIK